MIRFGMLALSALVAGAQPASAQDGSKLWAVDRDKHEVWLREASVLEVEDVGEGVTEPRKVTLQHGGTVFHAVYKPIRRGRHKGFWESYQAEVAAYQLDKLLGLQMVPPTIVRRVEGDLGSLQLWIPGCDTFKRLQSGVRMTPALSQDISRMKMFDNLIFNEDRNGGNFLLDTAQNVVLIDHSRAFLERKRLLRDDSKRPAQYDRALVDRLRELQRADLERSMDGLLMEGQIESLLERRDRILEHVAELVEEKGESRALFP